MEKRREDVNFIGKQMTVIFSDIKISKTFCFLFAKLFTFHLIQTLFELVSYKNNFKAKKVIIIIITKASCILRTIKDCLEIHIAQLFITL
jgi:hypothetical protein